MDKKYEPPVKVELELSAEQHDLLQKAAKKQGKSVSSFLKESLSKKPDNNPELSHSKVLSAKFKVLSEYSELLKRLGDK